MRKILVALFAGLIVMVGLCIAQTREATVRAQVMIAPNALIWKPFLPGAELALLQGNPEKEGLFTLRIRLRAGTQIPPHWHSSDENITILKGTLGIGMGDRFEKAIIRYMAAGAFVTLPKGMYHFALSKTDSIVQIHGEGPFVLNYVSDSANYHKPGEGDR